MSKNLAVVKEEPQFPCLIETNDDFIEALTENFPNGFKWTDLGRVGMPTSGGKEFSIPSKDGATDVKNFEGVIIHRHDVRTLWPPFEEGATKPLCQSDNLVTGIGSPGGECQSCPLSQWGSSDKGEGTACKEVSLLFVILEGHYMPITVGVTVGSAKSFKEYLREITMQGKSYRKVVTGFSLEQDKNANGIKFSKLKLSKVRDLEEGEQNGTKELKQLCESGVA
jgi:hypothetical protein